MAAPIDPASYKEVLIVLGAAGVVIPLFRRLGVSSVLGFLLTGVLIGPSLLGAVAADYPWLGAIALTNPERIATLAEFGIVFLMFMIGIELSFERLMTMRRLVFGLGSAQVILSSAAIAGVAWLVGSPPAEAVVIGLALSLSSTAIVIELLSNAKRLGTQSGRTSFAVLLFQDLAVVPILVLVTILGRRGGDITLAGAAEAVAQAMAIVGAIVLAGRYLLRPLLRMVAHTRSPDLFMAATLLIAVGTGFAVSYAGLSMAMGAFMAGLLIAGTEYRREVEAIIEPFKGIMLGAFFLLVGAGLDLAYVAAHPLAVVGFALLAIAIKFALTVGAGRVLGIARAPLTEASLLLAPGGEFAFVIINAALASGIVAAATGQTALAVVSLSMAAIPLFARLGRTASKQLAAFSTAAEMTELPAPDKPVAALVVGYGRVGQLVCELLEEHKVPHMIIETAPDVVARGRAAGKPIYFGDAARPEFLRRSGIAGAKAIAVTMDDPKKVEDVTQTARRENSGIKIVARARDDWHAKRLYELGATEAVPEHFEAALQVGEAVLVDAGLAMGLAIASVHERRDEHRKMLGRPDRRAELAKLRARRALTP